MVTQPNIDVLMRDEKEGRKKQARSNKRQGNTARPSMYMWCINCVLGETAVACILPLQSGLVPRLPLQHSLMHDLLTHTTGEGDPACVFEVDKSHNVYENHNHPGCSKPCCSTCTSRDKIFGPLALLVTH